MPSMKHVDLSDMADRRVHLLQLVPGESFAKLNEHLPVGGQQRQKLRQRIHVALRRQPQYQDMAEDILLIRIDERLLFQNLGQRNVGNE